MTISAKEYAAKIGYSPAAITKRLKSQRQPSLPGASSVFKFGNTWLINIELPFNKRINKKMFKDNLVNSN